MVSLKFERERGITIMTTTYYYAETNADNTIIATNGKIYFALPINSRGIDVTSGIDIYSGELQKIIAELKTAYASIDYLYNMNDIMMDYPKSVYAFDENDFERLTEIITIE